MNVILNQIDDSNANITVTVDKADISENVNAKLKEYAKKAKIPGFRSGKVPVGMIKKMYENNAIAEELNDFVSKALFDYIKNEKIKIFGEPLPSEKQEQIDFGNQEVFNFVFDIALIPQFDLNMSEKDIVTENVIKVDEKIKQSYIENYQNRFGNFNNKDVVDDKSIVTGCIFQIDDNEEIIENGVSSENAMIHVNMIKDTQIKDDFINSEINKSIIFDIKKAFENETDIAYLLKIKKEEVKDLNPIFKFTIHTIKEFIKAEINQELFDKVFDKQKVNSKEEFENKIVEIIKENFKEHTNVLLKIDIKEKLINETEINLSENFIKRWVKLTNKDLKDDELEKEFPSFINMVKWSIIKRKVVEDSQIDVSDQEVLEYIKKNIITQFKKYGIQTIAQEELDNYASEMFKKEEDKNNAIEQVIENKVVEHIKNKIKIQQKELTIDEMEKKFEEIRNANAN